MALPEDAKQPDFQVISILDDEAVPIMGGGAGCR